MSGGSDAAKGWNSVIRAAGERDERDDEQRGVRQDLRGSADALHPFADAEAEQREDRDGHDHRRADDRRVPRGAGEP